MKVTGDLASATPACSTTSTTASTSPPTRRSPAGRRTTSRSPAPCFRQTVDWFMQRRPAREGTIHLGGRRSTCARSSARRSTSSARPTTSSRRPRRRRSSTCCRNVDDVHFRAGHVGLIVGKSAQKRSIPVIADWLAEHSDEARRELAGDPAPRTGRRRPGGRLLRPRARRRPDVLQGARRRRGHGRVVAGRRPQHPAAGRDSDGSRRRATWPSSRASGGRATSASCAWWSSRTGGARASGASWPTPGWPRRSRPA